MKFPILFLLSISNISYGYEDRDRLIWHTMQIVNSPEECIEIQVREAKQDWLINKFDIIEVVLRDDSSSHSVPGVELTETSLIIYPAFSKFMNFCTYITDFGQLPEFRNLKE